ncbi:EAL domain-containing protein [Pseudoalteromonas sp. P1-7a]|uniref:EAL domain-containing protein n=1 Tax=Pseudoalteromonas sp. P1-7a TaxID=1723755 RepID=UPI0006D672E2|nr:EAL domain-containing protein [Pseudoalteromonas sp. P1-7a]KPZ59978.1 Cyclic di-GMP phosphodiesterase Gmr [Pseudoalteromonas sp. P1-7a]
MRLSILFFLFTTVYFLCINSVSATTNYAQQLQRISTDEGLSQNYVTKILQDDLGYIWIATAQGLNRFDGYTVTPFDGGFNLNENFITTLFKTHEGNIIVSTELAGAFLVDPKTLATRNIFSGSLAGNTANYASIEAVEQYQDTFYFAILNNVYSLSSSTNSLTLEFTAQSEETMLRALKYYQGTLFIGTQAGLFSYDLKTESLRSLSLQAPNKQTADNNNVKFLAIDPMLGLLVGTVEGMYALSLDKTAQEPAYQSTKRVIADYNIWDYTNTPYGEFIATEHGLFEFKRAKGTTELVLSFDQSKFNITENTINDLMVDSSGVFWLASRTQGVLTWSINTRRFKKVTLPKNNHINSIFQDADLTMWYGTDNGLAHVNADNHTTYHLTSRDPKAVYGEYAIFAINKAHLEPNSRYLWLTGYYNLILFDKKTGTTVAKKDLNNVMSKDATIYGVSEIAPDTFAFYNDHGFYVYNGKTGLTREIKGLKQHIDPLNAYTFHRPFNDYPNEFVISTTTHFYRYNEQTNTLTAIYKTSKKGNQSYHTVENWLIDKNNILWLATTSEGLVGIDAQSYEKKHHFNVTNALKTQSIYSLISDDYGYLWFSSKNGLYRLNTDTLRLRVFTVKDGLSVNSFSTLGAITLKNNNIMFGSSYGAISFDPAEFLQQSKQTTTAITDIRLMSRDLNYKPSQFAVSALELTHEDMGLEVSFSNFDFQNSAETRYKITLQGPTSLEYDNLKTNKIFFTTLPPGNYQLTASAYNFNSATESKPALLNFKVAYAPWKSPYAYAAYILIISTILCLLFWQYRSRQLAIANAQKATIHSQKQTELALTNNKSGIWDYHYHDESVNTNRGSELGYTNLPKRIPLKHYLALIHPEDKPRVISHWLNFTKQKKQEHWQATYRLKHKLGHWLWYQDLGQIIYDEQTHKPVSVSGIYTNITEQRANEQQANILGEAFGQINDWLLILDNNLVPVSANNSFIKTFSQSHTQPLSLKVFVKAIGKAQCKRYANTLKTLTAKQNWRTDTIIKTATNQHHPIHISATAIAKEANSISYYVIVISDLTEQKKAEDELRYLANFDPLTQLPNRSLMHQKISQSIEIAREQLTQSALLFIDLDKFKPVNDTFGHAVGDQLLCNITQRVSSMLPSNATLGRQSGDEFLVLIDKVEDISILNQTVKGISSELANKVIIEDFSINISASIGVALYPYDASSTDLLIRNADVAMMHAKQAGRNGFKFFNDSMNEKIKQKLILENDLKDAAKDQLLFNHYQPIIDTQAQTINGVELLMRWENNGQFVSPALFIPLAEETGLIEALTEQALERALSELAPTLAKNPLFYISLNLSPKHILRTNIATKLINILKHHKMSPVQLRLEITENILLEDKQKAAKQLQKLKAAGFKLLLDDFGTGYSSLTYLSQFPIDVIKIDQSFVNSIGSDKSDESIIKTIYTLAQNLGLYCIAEGVETKQQKAFLEGLGCHVVQGYYFAKPMRAQQLQSPETIEHIQSLINN